MVTLLGTSRLAAVAIAEGLKGAADTIRAGFGSTLAGESEMSFQTPYPETILVPTSAEKDGGEMGGFKWAPGFDSRVAFEGPYQNGTKDQLWKGLQTALHNYQRAIDQQYVSSEMQSVHAVFSNILRLAGAQALAILKSIIPLADMIRTTGMSETESWDWTALYPKALFDAIRLVRANTVKLKDQGGSCCGGLCRPP